jgi:GNAT superfamily N-acetyltransferase
MLRPNRPLEDVKFDGDEEDQTFHLGAFVENKLVSVASFYYQKHPELEGEHHYRLRGMATHPDHQCKGLSRELLNVAFPIIKQNFCSLVWCNAREGAVGFYEKVGFKIERGPFEIVGIGQHFLMSKSLER